MSPDAPLSGELQRKLEAFLAIPSVSSDPKHERDVMQAAAYVAEAITHAGGKAEVRASSGGPLVVGEVRASRDAPHAPAAILYGHFDVQPAGEDKAWAHPPFAATVDGEWLYGRGAADDKGQLIMLLEAVRLLVAADELPVNVRFVCDGDEEVGGTTATDFLRADDGPGAVFVSFDATMLRRRQATFDVGCRGLVVFRAELEVAARDLHSGMYGGAALNAIDALTTALQALRGSDGRPHPRLCEGIEPIPEAERGAWSQLGPASDLLEDVGALPADPLAAKELRERTWGSPSIDLHGIASGDPTTQAHVIPARACASFSVRLAPGQRPERVERTVRSLLAGAVPAKARLTVEARGATPPATVDVDHPWVRAARDVFTSHLGAPPLLARSGGTLPVMSAVADRGIPGVFTGFNLPEGNVHAPNERLLLAYVPAGIAIAADILTRFGRIQPAGTGD